jgi:Cu-processing system permease protein
MSRNARPGGEAPGASSATGSLAQPSAMRGIWIVAQLALQEALRRRVLAVVLVLTAVFGGLYTWGCSELFQDVSGFEGDSSGLDATALAGSTIVGLAMFGGLFLGTVLATFLTAGAVRGDAERGLLQPLVVRPLSRTQYLLGRFLAAATVAAAYVLLVYFGAVLVTGLVGDWWPAHPIASGLRLAGGAVLVAALSLLGSIFLSATANGILMLMAYGAGLLAGLLGAIGDAIPSPTLQHIASTASWVLPFEALYRDALRLLVQDVPGVAGAIVQLGPLGGSHDAGPLLIPWAVVYLLLVLAAAGWAFRSRDL